MWYNISYSKNYYCIPNTITFSISWLHLQSTSEIVSLHTKSKLSGMATVLKKTYYLHLRTTCWRCKHYILLQHCSQTTFYPNLKHRMFLHHRKTWIKKHKSVDGSCWENGIKNTMFFIITVINAVVLCTTSVLRFLWLPQLKLESKRYNTIESTKQFWNAKHWGVGL